MMQMGAKDERPLTQDLSDLQRLIQYLQDRREQLVAASGASFDRRVVDATILLSKLWTAALNLRLQGVRLS